MEEDMEGCHLLCTRHKASRPCSHHEVKLSSSRKHPGPSLLPGSPFLFISTSHLLIFRKNYWKIVFLQELKVCQSEHLPTLLLFLNNTREEKNVKIYIKWRKESPVRPRRKSAYQVANVEGEWKVLQSWQTLPPTPGTFMENILEGHPHRVAKSRPHGPLVLSQSKDLRFKVGSAG